MLINNPSGVRSLSLTDFDQNREAFVAELAQSLRDCGFAVLRDHSIPETLLQQAYQQIRKLFELPLPTKLRYDSGSGGERGYTAFGREKAAGASVQDLKEYWHIGPELAPDSPYLDQYPPNQWPQELAEFKKCFSALYSELENLALVVLQAIGQSLGVPENYFRELVQDGNSVFRLLHYPAVPDSDQQAGQDTAMRAAPHADINLLTLLIGATDSGLELLDRQGNWVAVESQPGEIVIDTGDMMARLTNNQLPATVHRVVNQSRTGGSRYSMPFFLHPHNGANLAPLPQCVGSSGALFEPISAGEFLHQRLAENGLK